MSIVDVNDWMCANRLRLNADKTQLIWLGSRQQLEKINVADVQFISANLRPLPSVRNLGVILDSRLSMAEEVTAICRACCYQLRQLRSVVHSLTPEAAKTLVHAFISCRLDNCHALLYGIADNQFQRLQSVQNVAGQLVTGSRRSGHITPVLPSLHWLPVRQRVTFKLATLVHKRLNGQAPMYLADFCRQTGDLRSGVRPAETWILDVSRARSTYTSTDHLLSQGQASGTAGLLPYEIR